MIDFEETAKIRYTQIYTFTYLGTAASLLIGLLLYNVIVIILMIMKHVMRRPQVAKVAPQPERVIQRFRMNESKEKLVSKLPRYHLDSHKQAWS